MAMRMCSGCTYDTRKQCGYWGILPPADDRGSELRHFYVSRRISHQGPSVVIPLISQLNWFNTCPGLGLSKYTPPTPTAAAGSGLYKLYSRASR
jgi:hypothetical protein